MKIKIFAVILLSALAAFGGDKIKNVIVMIPDGTSIGAVTLSRWVQYYRDSTKTNLNLDPYFCGMVKTHSSNAPIGDSAPTSSWFATGMASRTSFISMYPPADPGKDLVQVDDARKYQPLMTVLEASKLAGKKTGLVFTCYFPHATPADFSAHYYNRGEYAVLANQMVHNNIDVVFGGGTDYLLEHHRTYLSEKGFEVITDDYNAFRENKNNKVWALFEKQDMPYDIDRKTMNMEIPSFAEMTEKAIKLLSESEEGFFLMVEGSKVDWAAHTNDPVGIVSDFLAFDEAVGKAIEFAKKNGETYVMVLPDHGNSGITIGSNKVNTGYDRLSKHDLFKPVAEFSLSAYQLAYNILKDYKADSSYIQSCFSQSSPSFILTSEEIRTAVEYSDNYFKQTEKRKKERAIEALAGQIANMITSRTYIGFSSHGHTGEDVFLAVYDPAGDIPVGLISADSINSILCKKSGIVDRSGIPSLEDSTAKYFSKHFEVFPDSEIFLSKDSLVYKWNYESGVFDSTGIKSEEKITKSLREVYKIVLVVEKDGRKIELPAYTNKIIYDGRRFGELKSVTVYVDKNNTFYLPKNAAVEMTESE